MPRAGGYQTGKPPLSRLSASAIAMNRLARPSLALFHTIVSLAVINCLRL